MKRVLSLLFVMAGVGLAADQVPFVATFTALGPSGALPACGGAFPVPIALAGTGQATHMGQFSETQSHCFNLITGQLSGGQFTFTGANGDTVFGTYTGHVVPTSATTGVIYGVFVITGGTGRFAGATGGGAATGTLDFVTGEANDLVLKGTISRPNK